MLKIPKGLKKKKKGKKSKHKDDELFDSAELAELEAYKREKQQKEEAAAAAAAEGGEPSSSEKSEEWEKFKALTSGVDDILKKTQGDLDRIKSTSYFQKKPPGPSVPTTNQSRPPPRPEAAPVKGNWVGFEDNSSENVEEPQTAEPQPIVEETVPEFEEEEESEFEDDQDDIFDTSYVDVVASGEVRLVYVPDSPEKEDEGPDPFDTSIVDKVIKVDPNEKKKKLVSLGCAVEVLTGKLDKPAGGPPPEIVKSQRRRPRPQDLLLGSFDDGIECDQNAEPEPPPRSILDDDPFFEEKTSEILGFAPVTPVVEVKPPATPVAPKQELDLKNLVEEFIEFSATPEPEANLVEDDLEDEFAALAAESLSKHSEVVKEDEFNFEDDPFDTSFAAKILPGKFELKLIESEVLQETPPAATPDPKIKEVLKKFEPIPEPELKPLTPEKKDLLGGSATDLTFIDEPIAPKSQDEEPHFADPFDTSVVDKIVAPGKTEIKFLEKEFLDSVPDDDFDPRGFEKDKTPSRPDNLTVGQKRASVPKVVAFNLKSPNLPDLLVVDQEENLKASKPLTPYYPPQEEPVINGAADPFDTSFVSNPGKLELQLLEKELEVSEKFVPPQDLSDEEFDPRQGEPQPELNSLQVQPDIISGEDNTEVKLHTPVVPQKVADEFTTESDVDPFDTSIVSGLIPGKAEIKVLESEFLYTECAPAPVPGCSITEEIIRKSSQSSSTRQSVADVLEHPSDDISVKPLSPVTAGSFEFDDDVDPFDTSAVGDILPGKTEIKLLESELMLN